MARVRRIRAVARPVIVTAPPPPVGDFTALTFEHIPGPAVRFYGAESKILTISLTPDAEKIWARLARATR